MIFNVFVFYLILVFFLSLRGYMPNRLYWINCMLIMCFVGLRGYDIGSVDTINYVNYFLGRQKDYHISGKEIEQGLSIFNEIVRPFLKTGWMYLMTVSFITLLPLFYLIDKYAYNKHVCLLFLFIVLGNIISIYFVCLRQVLAFSFLLWGIILWLQKVRYRMILFLVLLGVGWFIHSVIILPGILFLCFNYVNISRGFYISMVSISYILGIMGLFDNFSMFAFLFTYSGSMLELLSNYANSEFTGSIGYLFPTFRTFLCILLCCILNKEQQGHVFMKMLLVGVVLSNAFPKFQEMYRLAGIFLLFGVVPISQMAVILYNRSAECYSAVVRKMIVPIRILFVAIILYSYCNYCASNMKLQNRITISSATLIPYSFFWEDKYNY